MSVVEVQRQGAHTSTIMFGVPSQSCTAGGVLQTRAGAKPD